MKQTNNIKMIIAVMIVICLANSQVAIGAPTGTGTSSNVFRYNDAILKVNGNSCALPNAWTTQNVPKLVEFLNTNVKAATDCAPHSTPPPSPSPPITTTIQNDGGTLATIYSTGVMIGTTFTPITDSKLGGTAQSTIAAASQSIATQNTGMNNYDIGDGKIVEIPTAIIKPAEIPDYTYANGVFTKSDKSTVTKNADGTWTTTTTTTTGSTTTTATWTPIGTTLLKKESGATTSEVFTQGATESQGKVSDQQLEFLQKQVKAQSNAAITFGKAANNDVTAKIGTETYTARTDGTSITFSTKTYPGADANKPQDATATITFDEKQKPVAQYTYSVGVSGPQIIITQTVGEAKFIKKVGTTEHLYVIGADNQATEATPAQFAAVNLIPGKTENGISTYKVGEQTVVLPAGTVGGISSRPDPTDLTKTIYTDEKGNLVTIDGQKVTIKGQGQDSQEYTKTADGTFTFSTKIGDSLTAGTLKKLSDTSSITTFTSGANKDKTIATFKEGTIEYSTADDADKTTATVKVNGQEIKMSAAAAQNYLNGLDSKTVPSSIEILKNGHLMIKGAEEAYTEVVPSTNNGEGTIIMTKGKGSATDVSVSYYDANAQAKVAEDNSATSANPPVKGKTVENVNPYVAKALTPADLKDKTFTNENGKMKINDPSDKTKIVEVEQKKVGDWATKTTIKDGKITATSQSILDTSGNNFANRNGAYSDGALKSTTITFTEDGKYYGVDVFKNDVAKVEPLPGGTQEKITLETKGLWTTGIIVRDVNAPQDTKATGYGINIDPATGKITTYKADGTLLTDEERKNLKPADKDKITAAEAQGRAAWQEESIGLRWESAYQAALAGQTIGNMLFCGGKDTKTCWGGWGQAMDKLFRGTFGLSHTQKTPCAGIM